MVRKLFTTLIIILATAISVNAESLFTLGAAQTTYTAAPKSLFTGVRAMSVGDLISIKMEENITVSDKMTYDSSRSSNTVDNFTTFINDLFGWNMKNKNHFGGENTVASSSGASRDMAFGNTIAAQVVQLMSNGNLVIQGKKTIVNGNERVDLIVTGVVDPRWIGATGVISSRNVSNLQFALSGRGSVSRGQNEGIINRVVRYLF